MNVLQKVLEGKAAAAMPQMIQPQGAMQNPMMAYSAPPQGGEVGDIGQRLMADMMRDFNLTPEQAAGFVGNLDHESGGFTSLQEINPTVKGSRGGFGYAQWTGPRRREFEGWAEANGLDPTSYEANYGFLRHELTATPEGRVLGDLRGARSVDEAARVVSNGFLRPGIVNMGSRVTRARKYAGYNPMQAYMGQQ